MKAQVIKLELKTDSISMCIYLTTLTMLMRHLSDFWAHSRSNAQDKYLYFIACVTLYKCFRLKCKNPIMCFYFVPTYLCSSLKLYQFDAAKLSLKALIIWYSFYMIVFLCITLFEKWLFFPNLWLQIPAGIFF